MEGLGRELGRLSSFGCGGFEIRGAELADSTGDSELAHALSMATKEEERERTEGAEDSEAGGELGKRGVVDLATSPAGKTGSPSTTATHSGVELRETSVFVTAHCAAQGKGRVRE